MDVDCTPTGSVKGFVNVTVQLSESPGLIWYGHCHEVDNHLSDQHLNKNNGIKKSEKIHQVKEENLNVDTVEPHSTDTRILRTVSFVPTRKNLYIFSKINPLNTDAG